MKISGKHFFVTGGASGLGEAAARALVAKGAKVTIADRDEEKGKALASQLGDSNAIFVQVDITDIESVGAAVNSAVSKWGNLWGAVNCAGSGLPMPILNRKGKEHDLGAFEWLVKLNLVGTFAVCTKSASAMSKNTPEDGERGVLINVASVAAFDGQNGQCAYSATKGAVSAMTLPMARDLGNFGIRVVTVAPGVFATPLTAPMEGTHVADGLKKQQVFPNDRFGQPDEFGHAVAFIAENGFMNGETMRLDAAVRMPKL